MVRCLSIPAIHCQQQMTSTLQSKMCIVHICCYWWMVDTGHWGVIVF